MLTEDYSQEENRLCSMTFDHNRFDGPDDQLKTYSGKLLSAYQKLRNEPKHILEQKHYWSNCFRAIKAWRVHTTCDFKLSPGRHQCSTSPGQWSSGWRDSSRKTSSDTVQKSTEGICPWQDYTDMGEQAFVPIKNDSTVLLTSKGVISVVGKPTPNGTGIPAKNSSLSS